MSRVHLTACYPWAAAAEVDRLEAEAHLPSYLTLCMIVNGEVVGSCTCKGWRLGFKRCRHFSELVRQWADAIADGRDDSAA